MRSGSAGDPMGSTDTMTPSEVSTNVTLDTVSSHSGSQPASCRAICGSLASFDTSSVLNTEGLFLKYYFVSTKKQYWLAFLLPLLL